MCPRAAAGTSDAVGSSRGPPSPSTSAPPQQSIERAVPSNVPSPPPSAEGYTLIRRIYCEDTQSGAIQGRTELKVTSPLSCEEAKDLLLVWERQKTTAAFLKMTLILSIPPHEKVNTKRKNGSARLVAKFRHKRPGPMCKGYDANRLFGR